MVDTSVVVVSLHAEHSPSGSRWIPALRQAEIDHDVEGRIDELGAFDGTEVTPHAQRCTTPPTATAVRDNAMRRRVRLRFASPLSSSSHVHVSTGRARS